MTKITVYLFLLICSNSYGQMGQYNFQRTINGNTEQWNKIILPNDIFAKVSNSLFDIRIYGITAKCDTIEAPYLLRLLNDKMVNKEVKFKIFNTSSNEKGYFFTFDVPKDEIINQITLDFLQKNFDWKIKLEGSQNLKEWVKVLDDYRILSIKNDQTNFQFTNVSFQDSRYHYFRLFIESKERPELISAKVSQLVTSGGEYRNYHIQKINYLEPDKSKQTVIDIDLKSRVPVSYIKVKIKDTFDYYRPLTIKYLSDSVKTDNGWVYNYNTLMQGTINSFEMNEFKFKSTILQKLKIIIHNRDNQPLNIRKFEVKGPVHELVIRFTDSASYYMVYGNPNAEKPQYDLNKFISKIPDSLTTLELGTEQIIIKVDVPVSEPLFKNKAWLWLIISVICLLLGWSTFSMMRKR